MSNAEGGGGPIDPPLSSVCVTFLVIGLRMLFVN